MKHEQGQPNKWMQAALIHTRFNKRIGRRSSYSSECVMLYGLWLQLHAWRNKPATTLTANKKPMTTITQGSLQKRELRGEEREKASYHTHTRTSHTHSLSLSLSLKDTPACCRPVTIMSFVLMINYQRILTLKHYFLCLTSLFSFHDVI